MNLFNNMFFENLDAFFNLDLPEPDQSTLTKVDLENGNVMSITEESGPGFTRTIKTITPSKLKRDEEFTILDQEFLTKIENLNVKIGSTEYDMKSAARNEEYEEALKLQKFLRELKGELETTKLAYGDLLDPPIKS